MSAEEDPTLGKTASGLRRSRKSAEVRFSRLPSFPYDYGIPTPSLRSEDPTRRRRPGERPATVG